MQKEKDVREALAESYSYARVRQKILDSLRRDLIGPIDKEEKLEELKLDVEECYITGKLYPSLGINDTDSLKRRAIRQSSCGLYCYLGKNVETIQAEVTWAEYSEKEEEIEKKKKKNEKKQYTRELHTVPCDIHVAQIAADKKREEGPISDDCDKVWLRVVIEESKLIKENYRMLFVSVCNKREEGETRDDAYKQVMYQVRIKLSAPDGEAVFVPEYLCRPEPLEDDYRFEKNPVYARGFGCAAMWETNGEPIARGCNASSVWTSFIPDCEINRVSQEIDSLTDLGMKQLAESDNDSVCGVLGQIETQYKNWIDQLRKHDYMSRESFKNGKGSEIIAECENALIRIHNGIQILKDNQNAWDAFVFMNKVMYRQRAMGQFAGRGKQGGEKKDWELEDFYEEDKTEWRPFQIAFILLNLAGITQPTCKDREIVDLLYFPTGGGKTEAYLGLIAFTMAYRRLLRSPDSAYERDGGVTVILRYTLRLLTKQQRDRLSLMVLAAELVRKDSINEGGSHKFGETSFSIGFWVGGQVTPNQLGFYKKDKTSDKYGEPYESHWKLLSKQLTNCPCCGAELGKENYNFKEVRKSGNKKSLRISCHGKGCRFGDGLPIYLVDEDIYRERPTVVIATVDKFAQLPLRGGVRTLFGFEFPAWPYLKKFYPPELIIQDELHLITGSLGSLYGGYEALVEELCTVEQGDKKIRPKYVVSTATIENAKEQIHNLYGRSEYCQFPPEGFETGEAFFINEVALPTISYSNFDPQAFETDKSPFRQYVGICGNGISTLKTMSYVYASILQTVQGLLNDNEVENKYVDPYYTLIGFFNTIRELGSTVWQLEDESEIPAKIAEIAKKNESEPIRVCDEVQEITSRLESDELADVLNALETKFSDAVANEDGEQDENEDDSGEALDVALATNMIAVGLDIDRLGLMVTTRPPNANSEYIQVTSRVGRKYPGLIVTVYSPYQDRNLSYYENFVGFHSQLYRCIEGTTATPFAEYAWERILHVLVVGLLRLRWKGMVDDNAAAYVKDLRAEEIQKLLGDVLVRIGKALGSSTDRNNPNLPRAEKQIESFLDGWISTATKLVNEKKLHTLEDCMSYVYKKSALGPASDRKKCVMIRYENVTEDDLKPDKAKQEWKPRPTMNSLRDVQPNIQIDYDV